MSKQLSRRLSVAVITFNEEKNIEELLNSVSSVADEILILDSHSTDKTKDLALKNPKVRFLSQDFQGHVEQKNLAMSFCKNEWILSLDADERLNPVLQESIQNFLEKEEVLQEGFRVSRLTFHLGRWIRHSGWYPQKRYRLVKKGSATWKGENPHDYLDLVHPERGGDLKGDILHYSFLDFSHQIQTINQFSSIVAFTRFKKGKHFSVLKSLLKPIWKFFEIYLFKRGFMDGIPGLFIALSSSFSTFLKYAKIYELENEMIERPSNLRKDYGEKK